MPQADSVAPKSALIHASTVSLGPEAGIMIEGPSGSGKSRLAMALMACGAQLVADDISLLFRTPTGLFVRAPHSISGLIEARGLGILRTGTRRLTRITLVIGLMPGQAVPPRLPAPRQCERLGHGMAWLAGPGAAHDVQAFARALVHRMRCARTP